MTVLTAPVLTDPGSQPARRDGGRRGTVLRAHLLAPIPYETRTGG